MRKSLLTIALALASIPSLFAANPQANPQAIVTSGNARFTVLTPQIIRIEYSPEAIFEDNATVTVVNRELPVPPFTTRRDYGKLFIDTDKLHLTYKEGEPLNESSLEICLDVDGTPTCWHPGLRDSLNLKGTFRTLDGCNGDSHRKWIEDGVISRSGWAIIDDSPATVRADGSHSLALVPDATTGIDWVATRRADNTDLYFMGYGHDYKKALYDYTLIAGKTPLPPDYVFGYWYSKYENYTADDFRSIADNLRNNDVNADVMILDMDWHWNGEQQVSGGRGSWTGWSWNTNLIPNPDSLLSDLHSKDFHIALNLHPAQGILPHEDQYAAMCRDLGLDAAKGDTIAWQLENKDFALAFFRNIIRPLEAQGVDFWWLDWQQHLTSPFVDGLGETMWCNHVFFNEMKKSRPDHRPLIFHRWGGLGSHRYQIGFSGDTFINYATLAFLPYFTATASNVGYGYWGHDLGGHVYEQGVDVNNPELLLRWLQMGVFTPIFRTHATKGPWINRQIWTYPNFPQLNAAVKLRYAMFPYLYSMARKSYDTGVGICRPMYYEHPYADEAYTNENQYYYGDDILVAPVVEPSVDGVSHKNVWLPEGQWWSAAHNILLDGNRHHELDYTLDQIPYFYRVGSIVVNNPPEVHSTTERPDRLIINIIAGANGTATLYEDSGDNADYDSRYATTAIAQTHKGRKSTYTIASRQGAADGLAAERGYELRIFNTPAPARKVTVDGRKAAATYDPATRCTTITLPAAPCTTPRTVTVE